ncbi:hypothetical protein FKR81_24610 [Lentzea tibetensis]|uniref:Uncharacterized protein n=1 Tax=Lentzea tibetensis TaxID=2591470 RepID=A0A563EPL5_9PSEU|nr:hypothetical protein [Lentzea tibetensis]TWP49296.1 hypothetical protein FKR81_24610 [Lentzea tibetensis]
MPTGRATRGPRPRNTRHHLTRTGSRRYAGQHETDDAVDGSPHQRAGTRPRSTRATGRAARCPPPYATPHHRHRAEHDYVVQHRLFRVVLASTSVAARGVLPMPGRRRLGTVVRWTQTPVRATGCTTTPCLVEPGR